MHNSDELEYASDSDSDGLEYVSDHEQGPIRNPHRFVIVIFKFEEMLLIFIFCFSPPRTPPPPSSPLHPSSPLSSRTPDNASPHSSRFVIIIYFYF